MTASARPGMEEKNTAKLTVACRSRPRRARAPQLDPVRVSVTGATQGHGSCDPLRALGMVGGVLHHEAASSPVRAQ